MGYGDVINVPCCLNCAEEVLIPNLLETHVWLVGRSAFALKREHKHTGTIVTAGELQCAEFIKRQMTHLVCTCGECLSADHKLEGHHYNNVVPNLRLGSHT